MKAKEPDYMYPTYFTSLFLKPVYLITWNPTCYLDDIHENEWCIHKYVCKNCCEKSSCPSSEDYAISRWPLMCILPINNPFKIKRIYLSTVNLYPDYSHGTWDIPAMPHNWKGSDTRGYLMFFSFISPWMIYHFITSCQHRQVDLKTLIWFY